MNYSITHLTSVHKRYDTRIFLKMCSSLAKNENYEVSLVVADGQGSEKKNGVSIIDVGAKSGGKLSRITTTVKKVYQQAISIDSDIYHLHDPELLRLGLKLKKLGKKVIFDAHEDFPRQLLGKPYLNKFLLTVLSKSVVVYENYTCKKFDVIIAATPFIREKFLAINKNSVDINNFPILSELSSTTSWEDKKDEICYVGSIAKVRGIREIVKSMAFIPLVKLNLVGTFSEKNIEIEVKNYESWSMVNELGFLGRADISKVLNNSKAGLVTLHPIVNYIDALPVKMFEYMAAGLPVISSNIELWQEIVEGNSCGICVDPLNPEEIADAINYILTHSKEARHMGENGKEAVLTKYNWSIEEKKLFKVYKGLENELDSK